MAIYVPIVQTRYLFQYFFSAPKFAQLMASGVLDIGTLDITKTAGDFVSIPQIVQATPFIRVDITDTSAASGTRVSTNDAKAPVIRDYSLNTFTESDMSRSGENFEMLLAQTAGNQLARRMLRQINNVLKGAIQVSGLNHINDIHATGDGAATVQSIRATKALLGDQGSELHTALVNSKVWWDLSRDLVENYKYMGQTSGEIIMDGQLDRLMGIRNWIVSDDMVPDSGATSSAGDDIYFTWLLGDGALYLSYQKNLRDESFVDTRVPSTLFYSKFAMDYALAPRGMAYSGSANPTDANLADNSNWAQANEDSRNVRIVGLESLGGVY